MKIVLAKGSIEKAPKTYTRVRFVKEKGVKRLAREGGIEFIELSVPNEMNRRKLITLFRTIIMAAKSFKAKRIAVSFADTPALWKGIEKMTPKRISELAAENYEMANFEFTKFKTKPKDGWNAVEEIAVYGPWDADTNAGAKDGQIVGQEVNRARDLANMPGGSITPRGLATAAKAAAKGLPITVTTMGRAQIVKAGMGLLAGVGAGSAHEPTFTVMQYKAGKAVEKPIVLAGKGITFDSGGMNLKPSNSIYEMHMDMSGAAAVIHTITAIARLKVKRNVIALIPAAENMIGTNATRPGDIHRSLSGKTVEVTDTDAEGRLVLADVITYAKRFKPSVVIDVATLTGAALVALGFHASGLMTRNDKLAQQLLEQGEESGDYLWRLPLWDEYETVVKSEFADVQNHSISGGRYGGATNGAIFLWQFAKELDCPWAHLDIAPRMTSTQGDELAKGAAGAPIRLLIQFIQQWHPLQK